MSTAKSILSWPLPKLWKLWRILIPISNYDYPVFITYKAIKAILYKLQNISFQKVLTSPSGVQNIDNIQITPFNTLETVLQVKCINSVKVERLILPAGKKTSKEKAYVILLIWLLSPTIKHGRVRKISNWRNSYCKNYDARIKLKTEPIKLKKVMMQFLVV